MRILMLAHNIAWQGSAIRALSLARPLSRLGHDVTVVASRLDTGVSVAKELVDGVLLLQFPDVMPVKLRGGGLSPIDLAGRLAHVIRNRYDIVHAFEHRPCSTVPALLEHRLHRAVYVADWADLWGSDGMAAEWPTLPRLTLGAFDGRWQTYTRRHADAVTAISTDLAERARRLGVGADRIRLLPPGANGDTFTPASSRLARRRLSLPEDALVLVHTGFAPFDDWLLARVFTEAAAREPRVQLVTAGRRVLAVDKAAAIAGCSDRVHQLGTVSYSGLGDVMACGDLMLIPYTRRPHNVARFPNRVGDYLAAGRPIATNPTGDLGSLVIKEGIGVVAPEEPTAFADAILDLLDRPQQREEMGARARRLAETTFSWRARAEALNTLYRELALERGRGVSTS
jgi:glycosyltransferase involved in cell wall biosynthesis